MQYVCSSLSVAWVQKLSIVTAIDKTHKLVDIIGGVDGFELGPLSVRGLKGPRTDLECHIGVSKQELAVDGIITLFGMDVQTHVIVKFLPKPVFKFYL